MENNNGELIAKARLLNDTIDAYYRLAECHAELGDPDEAALWTESTMAVIRQIRKKRDAVEAEISAQATLVFTVAREGGSREVTFHKD